MYKRRLASLIVIAAALAAPQARAQAPGGPPPKVTVAKPVVREIIEQDQYTGRFDPIEFVEVRARVTGYLEKINFTDGATVKKGDVLFVIDRRPYKAALEQAQASLTSAKARLSFSQTDLERAQTLSKGGNISEQVTDQRRQASQTAQADVDSAEAALRNAQLNFDFSEVKSPINGRISQRLVTEGNIVITDQTMLTTIVSLDPIYFSFTVDEKSFLKYQGSLGIGMGQTQRGKGVPILIALSGEAKPTRKGTLDFVDNRVDNSTGTILLRATVENADGFIKPGLFGIVSMPATKPFQGVMIPDEAVAANQDKRIVYLVGEDGTVTAKDVKLGPKVDGYRVIRDGLKGDETIVVNGTSRVRPGAKVSPESITLPPSKT
ncbi:efflux RND transporter periplasmic adaptor subunit [Methylobacterium sp. E-041]|jgi:RND family efflux transporter MFP subunit|uniref:efflux RND transporter periplasmic adaptor subunit n=1 Tax=unclassified Methylobacterium TaxID=2615210 RepID=UPI0011CBE03A|nr:MULTISPECIES: efflux RND transporter periplasmic adaptor subunit [unclassified Methylobacterium]MCJ2010074.1 efflux RND transporter periplasmic adaptor subunit [Methylobacterium sp. J-092]MCJ2038703.1 efflux RND transporter periplasmic adaptor subunit [Methylobacterium sp. J-059]MCJ2109334.1 efflux RND transporter periplasmic adaptor subunit [Methylobacterium sp. E-041]MCJ2111143.1 efflux RND transporter periplasmic adaptor subunit [Methylobacterium sp. E-025]TXM90365.1 efflux RND transport